MRKELVIIYDTPAITHFQIMAGHYLQFFEKIRILYWSKETTPAIFEKEAGRIIFYPYQQSYDSRHINGLKFMFWIAKTLGKICQEIDKETQLVFLTVIPLWAGLPTLLIGKLKKKKTILRLEAQKFEYLREEARLEGTLKSPLFLKLLVLKLVYRFTIPLYDAVIGISEGVSKEARGDGAKRIITIPLLVNLEPFFAEGKKEETTKKEKPILLYVGQTKKIKGLEDLISSLRLLEQEGIKPKLLVAGEVTNPKDEAFLKKIKNLSQGLEIHFLGWLSHNALVEVHQQADIFILPSYTEALGIVMMEAMASGLPVISTKTSGGQYLVEEGKTGFLVEKGKPEQLKEKIKILIENSSLRESMGLAGKERIKRIMVEALQKEKLFWQEMMVSAK